MAEGVAEVYAADPAVADAGLSEEEFVRVFVALIDQESRFNPLALSPKGARGLGQLMPETAARLGVEDATEPMANLHGAARYLTAQLAAFGRVDWALAAYNAGPHRVAQYHGIPPYRGDSRLRREDHRRGRRRRQCGRGDHGASSGDRTRALDRARSRAGRA